MRHIIVSTDFSPESENAVVYAASLAKDFGVSLHLLNVIKPPLLLDDNMLASMMEARQIIIDENTALIEQEKERLSQEYLIRVTGELKEGYPAETIIEMAQEQDVDMIVMGMKGKGKSNSLFGSTTTTVIRKLTHPVMVVPLQANYAPVQHLTLASDFRSDIDTKHYRILQEMLERSGAELHILNVQKKEAILPKEKVIGKMRTSKAFSKSNPEFHVVAERKVEAGIQQFITDTSTDMLAMLAYPHSFHDRLFGTVHTKTMSYLTHIPLLVIPAK